MTEKGSVLQKSAPPERSDEHCCRYAHDSGCSRSRPGFLFRRHHQQAPRRHRRDRRDSLRIINDDQQYLVDEWNYADLRWQSAPEGVLRLGRHGETLLARLEIRDAALASAIEDRAATLDRGGVADRRLRRAWSS